MYDLPPNSLTFFFAQFFSALLQSKTFHPPLKCVKVTITGSNTSWGASDGNLLHKDTKIHKACAHQRGYAVIDANVSQHNCRLPAFPWIHQSTHHLRLLKNTTECIDQKTHGKCCVYLQPSSPRLLQKSWPLEQQLWLGPLTPDTKVRSAIMRSW